MNSKQRRQASRKKWAHMYSVCPKCKTKKLVNGYGFAGGGGIGSYESCESKDCGYFHKEIDNDAMSDPTGTGEEGMPV